MASYLDFEKMFHSERALRLDYGREIVHLQNKNIQLTTRIMELEAQLLKTRNLRFVVCGNYEEFREFRSYQRISNIEYVHVSGAETLKGTSNPAVIFHGSWMDHPSIIDIITQIKIATRK